MVSLKGWTIDPIQLHLDKYVYNNGDQVRIKGYIIDERLRSALDFRMVFFGPSSNQVIKEKRLKSEQIESGISFQLPDTLQSGIYQLQVFDEHYSHTYNHSSFVVLNLEENTVLAKDHGPAIDFFIEGGGDLISDIENTLIVSCRGLQGSNHDYTVVIHDQNDSILYQKKLPNSGLSRVSIKPISNARYGVSLVRDNALILKRDLPKSTDSGIVMNLTQEGSKRIYLDINTVDLPQNNTIQILHEHRIIQETKIADSHFHTQFALSQLPEGILQFRMLNPSGETLKSRLFFNRKQHPEYIVLRPDKEIYRPGESIKLAVTKIDREFHAVNSSFSISVWDHSQIQDLLGNKQNIWSLHFSSLGLIAPGVKNYLDESKAAEWILDDFMITMNIPDEKIRMDHTWVNDLSGIYLMGNVVAIDSQEIKPKGVVLTIPGTDEGVRYTSITSNNQFLFTAFDFHGIKDAYLSVWPPTPGRYRWSIHQPQPQIASSTLLLSDLDHHTLTGIIKHQRIRKRVETQYLNYFSATASDGKEQEPLNTLKYVDREIILDNYVRFPDVKTAIKEVVPYVQYKKTRFKVFSPELRRTFPNRPLVLLDGIPVADSIILDQNPSVFERIEVVNTLENIYAHGKVAENGIVAFYTRPGHNIENLSAAKVKIMGYHKNIDEGLSVDDEPNEEAPHLPDLLFWNQHLLLGKGNEVIVEFKAPDYETNLKVHIEAPISDNEYTIVEKMIKIAY